MNKKYFGIGIILTCIVYCAYAVLVTNSQYPAANKVNVVNWPDSTVPMPVTGTFTATVGNVGVTNVGSTWLTVSNVVAGTSEASIGVTNLTGSTLNVNATNSIGLSPTNQIFVQLTNSPVTVSNTIFAQLTNSPITISNTVYVELTNSPVTISNTVFTQLTNSPITISNTVFSQLTNSPITISNTVTVSGTNQVSFCIGATNIAACVTNAGVVTNCAFAVTNAGFNIAGGSGLLQSITINTGTNAEYVVWAFNRGSLTAALTPGSAWTPGPADLQYCIGQWATSDSRFGSWQLAGTNYFKFMGNLAAPCKNTDNSQNLVIVGTYLGTQTNYTANSIYVRVGMINDK